MLMEIQTHILTVVKELMMKINLKMVISLEYQNLFLQKAIFQIGLKKLLWLKKLKTLCRGHILLVILKANKLLDLLRKMIAKSKSKRVYCWKSNEEKSR